jgi:hypothetical protein
MAQEQIGPDSPDRPTVSQPGWNPGIVELPRHPSRVYSIWVNGNESFNFQASPEAMNDLIDLFSKARLRDHEIWIKPGTNTLKTFGGTSVNYNACLTINSGIALAFRREQESEATLEPGLILYTSEAGPALNQLKFPENVIVHCEVPGADFKRNSSIPERKAWYGRIQSGDTNPATMKENGLVTQVTLWDTHSSDGIPLGNVSPDGHFKAVFSDEEFAALNRGDLWITVTTGNFMTAPRKEDQHFPVALLSRERDGAKPLMLGHLPSDTGSLDAERVLAIARAAVATNDTWLDKAEFETPKRKADGTWSVMVWRLPKTPGGHRLITVDATGKVTDYMRGI